MACRLSCQLWPWHRLSVAQHDCMLNAALVLVTKVWCRAIGDRCGQRCATRRQKRPDFLALKSSFSCCATRQSTVDTNPARCLNKTRSSYQYKNKKYYQAKTRTLSELLLRYMRHLFHNKKAAVFISPRSRDSFKLC